MPVILDPFAGGGSIPLEAQRLGLEAHASDLNPVAVLINKALIEIPPRFAGRSPVFPGAAESRLGDWPRATGLAEDVRRYGGWMRERAQERIGHLYPPAKLPDGSTAPVIAWIWARTATCPNPACGIEMPLTSKWRLGKKKGKEAYVVPSVVPDPSVAAGRRVVYTIGHDPAQAPTKDTDGTMSGRRGALCVACGTAVPTDHIKAEGVAGRMGAQLLAIVAEGARQRIYLPPNAEHIAAADVARPDDVPEGEIATNPRWFSTPAFGMTEFADLFTNRQLVALTTFSDLVGEAREQVLADALASGLPEGTRLEAGGSHAAAYADAVATYLAMTVSRLADLGNSLCRWEPVAECPRQLFGRQAVAMVWDYAEGNSLGESSGSWQVLTGGTQRAFASAAFSRANVSAHATQGDALEAVSRKQVVISTDPPYYDNIGYSDLSDFFYIWLRRTSGDQFPALFGTLLVPKADELVANPYRHGGRDTAEQFFETRFRDVFTRARDHASPDMPIAVYYAFKQAELKTDGVSSTGWATMLEGIIGAGWSVTGTWPLRTETSSRLTAQGTNALASSIVLALRPRHEDAQATTRRGFLAALKAELPHSLREMQQGAIAPVDLAQATIGPGMAVFSRHSRVVEADGSAMSVKTALALINHALDEVLAEQDGDLDVDTRFALKWYEQYGFGLAKGKFGEADVLARATNTSVEGLKRGGILASGGGDIRLLAPTDLDASWDPLADDRISVWEATMHLARVLDTGGVEAAAALIPKVGQRIDLDAVQLIAYRLYELSQANRPADALLFNALGTSWGDLASTRRTDPAPTVTAPTLNYGDEDE